MIKDKTFRITYKKSNGETITRFGKFDDKCRYWTSKVGSALNCQRQMGSEVLMELFVLGMIFSLIALRIWSDI